MLPSKEIRELQKRVEMLEILVDKILETKVLSRP